jgi:hypothetical protein
MVTKTFPQEIYYGVNNPGYKSTWERIVDAAEKHNDPGNFTALIGYEWTSTKDGNNLHRNVLYRDGGEKALQVLPYTTLAPVGSMDPMDLWKWMTEYEEETGGNVLALAHNGNLSNGLMFPVDAQYTGRKLDEFYVKGRCMRLRRSRETGKHIPSYHQMMSLRIMKPGTSETSFRVTW